jgi:hypothetical protein
MFSNLYQLAVPWRSTGSSSTLSSSRRSVARCAGIQDRNNHYNQGLVFGHG